MFPVPDIDEPHVVAGTMETAVFAGGCFWGMQAVFEHVRGVASVTAGYSGGGADTAHYDMVSSGATGHAESVRIGFDASKVSYGSLLQVFFSVAHDPTELNYQGPDHGSQYRSVVFVTNAQQERVVRAYVEQLNAAHVLAHPIVTQVVPLDTFYRAETYHQDYLGRHLDDPYIVYNDLPKLTNLAASFPSLYRR